MNDRSKEDLGGAISEIFIEGLRKGHSVQTNIKGRSMHPLIRKSDIVTVQLAKFEETKVGDVVVYTRNIHHGFTVHRLIRKIRDSEGRKSLITKGDASRHGDPPVYTEELCGKVATIERGDGRVIHLDTRYRRLQGYLIAKRSWFVGILRTLLIKSPHLVPIKVIYRFGLRLYF